MSPLMKYILIKMEAITVLKHGWAWKKVLVMMTDGLLKQY